MTKYVLSFFDLTGEAVRPWAEAGYTCFCYDIQHPKAFKGEMVGDGVIYYQHADLSAGSSYWLSIIRSFVGADVAMVFGFPPCTDLASSGARHWESKRQVDPEFQGKAVDMARMVEVVAQALSAPYAIENPVGALCTLWRKPNYRFHPYEYGGYLPEGEPHPIWPDYIPPQDAYTKQTCLWTGNGFVMPAKLPVPPVIVTLAKSNGKQTSGSPQWGKLGGKSIKTKNIRSATPRGFAVAVYEANAEFNIYSEVA